MYNLYLSADPEVRQNDEAVVNDLVEGIRSGLMLDESPTKGGGTAFLKDKKAPPEIIEAWRKAEEEGRVHFMNSWATRDKEGVAGDFLEFLGRHGIFLTDIARTYLFKNPERPGFIGQWLAAAMDGGMLTTGYEQQYGGDYIQREMGLFRGEAED